MEACPWRLVHGSQPMTPTVHYLPIFVLKCRELGKEMRVLSVNYMVVVNVYLIIQRDNHSVFSFGMTILLH